MPTASPHTFHIPVMGLGYTIDTPLKVAHLGITSVVSIIEDELVERMREHHARSSGEAYVPIPKPGPDHRARRITAYLDLLHRLVDGNVRRVRATPITPGSESALYFELLPDEAPLRERYHDLLHMPPGDARDRHEAALREAIVPGAIDVNIMAKIDPTNYDADGNALPPEQCDAMAAFRGFANSTLDAALVLSAGYNPRLYAYIATFPDFLPDAVGRLRKRVVLKVSDLRSAQVQGRILAKKGVWVSEFRIESGLNCGGHAFATDGLLMGPILEAFRQEREALADELWHTCNTVLAEVGRPLFPVRPAQRITAQGGIGTAAEDRFLRTYYGVDGTGWGSPFLLVPEATNVDPDTLEQLTRARPEDFYLSHASPLGVPFHNFRPSTSNTQLRQRIDKNRPGSPCYKKFLSSNTEFTERPICTASRQYQQLKVAQLEAAGLDDATLQREVAAVTEKACLCEGLGAAALLKAGMRPAHKLEAVAICPGPNTAYFNKVVSLRTMVDHIHGRTDLLKGVDRPHMFIKELSLYVDHLRGELERAATAITIKQQRQLTTFRTNLLDGIRHYLELLPTLRSLGSFDVSRMHVELEHATRKVRDMMIPGIRPA
ncbi:MAG: hypothetical protein RBT71_04380 [Flavobacteriales bacterium]|jgi:hypothetical protein|nr:hypothetical protein [Flavobacteriales bacterium]